MQTRPFTSDRLAHLPILPTKSDRCCHFMTRYRWETFDRISNAINSDSE